MAVFIGAVGGNSFRGWLKKIKELGDYSTISFNVRPRYANGEEALYTLVVAKVLKYKGYYYVFPYKTLLEYNYMHPLGILEVSKKKSDYIKKGTASSTFSLLKKLTNEFK
jgi:hypothetical protein